MHFTGKASMGLAALIVLVAAFGRPAAAQDIPLQNAGFESPTTSSFTYDDITGWTGDSTPNYAYGVQLYSGTAVNAPADGGNQFAYINVGDIYQDTSTSLTAGVTYSFAAEVGYRLDEPAPAVGELEILTTSGQLLATSGPVTARYGQFNTFSVLYTALDPTVYGQDLRVELVNANSNQSQVDFDNVSLTARPAGSPAPEPSSLATMALFALGLGALVLKARRKKAIDA